MTCCVLFVIWINQSQTITGPMHLHALYDNFLSGMRSKVIVHYIQVYYMSTKTKFNLS